MQPFEALVLVGVSLLLVATCLGRRLGRLAVPSLGLIGVAAGLHLALEQPRWQMLPAAVLLLALLAVRLKRSRSHWLLRSLSLSLGLATLAGSLALGVGLPVLVLPAPEGPQAVGTTAYSLVDTSRPETRTADPHDRRELFVEVWYPGLVPATGAPAPRTLWSELYQGEVDQVSLVMGYLAGVDTHSHPELPVATGGPFPVVVFNHGLQMFTSQNTLLMEHLASHGFVVVAIGHPHDSIRVRVERAGTVLPGFIRSWAAFQQAMAWIEEASRPVVEALAVIERIDDPEQRAAVMLAAIEGSEVNATVSLWVEDTRFVLDHLASGGAAGSPIAGALDLERLGVMGMSVGGAAAAELCRIDRRCDAGIDVDGLAYGERHALPLEVPFLMLYSDDGAGGNDMLRLAATHDYYEAHLRGRRHSDLTDLALVWPLLGWAGQAGEVSGPRSLGALDALVLDFLDRYLRDGAAVLDGAAFPELEVRAWLSRSARPSAIP